MTPPLQLVVWSALAAGLPAVADAQATAYYADIHKMGVMAEVSVNGTRIYSENTAGGGAHSQFLTPYLVTGRNRVTVVSRLEGETPMIAESAWLQCDIAAAPADAVRSAEQPGRMLFSQRIEPVRRSRLTLLKDAQFDMISGSMAPELGPLQFEAKGERRWAAGISLLEDAVLDGVPDAVAVAGSSQTLARVEVHFIDGKSAAHVAFGGLKVSKGATELKLDRTTLKHGLEHLDHSRFDTVWVFGFSAAGVEDVAFYGLDLIGTRESTRVAGEFTVELPFAWSWEKAAPVTGLATDPALRAEAVDFLKRLHSTLDAAPVDEWLPYFEPKLTDLARAMGKPEDEMRTGQVEFFNGLKAIQGWKLEPFDPQRLRLVAVNDRLIDVSYVDSAGPIISVPLVKPGGDKPDRFTMPLSIAKIGGEWKVTR